MVHFVDGQIAVDEINPNPVIAVTVELVMSGTS
jgi:hypothetical protein